jgi:hypothetical protein
MISAIVLGLNTQYRVSSPIWSTWPTQLSRFRINPIQWWEAELTVGRTNEICADLGYNPAVVPKSVDRIHQVRRPAKSNSDVPISFVFITGPDSFRSEEPSSLPGKDNGHRLLINK